MTRSAQTTLWRKAYPAPAHTILHLISAEPISDDMAVQIRGGDKDYSPTYEYREEKQSQFSTPSMLLDL